MAVQKWSWTGTNPVQNKQSIPYVKFNATADEVKKAYAALLNKGRVADFSYKVWNDLCGKILDINRSWQTNNYFGHTYPMVWITSPYLSDYPDEDTFNYENGVAGGSAGGIRAFAMNMAARALIPTASRPWEKYTGRSELKKGDDCKAEYFLWMVSVINHWCELTPMWWSWSDKYALVLRNRTNVIPSIQTRPEDLNLLCEIMANGVVDESRLMEVLLQMYLKSSKPSVVLPQSVPMSSPMNFSTLNIKFGLYAENIIFINSFVLQMKYDGMLRLAVTGKVLVKMIAEFVMKEQIKAAIAKELIGIVIRASEQHSGTVKLETTGITSFRYKDSSQSSGTVKFHFLRPVPMSALTHSEFAMKVFVEHEGIMYLTMKDEIIPFADTSDMSADTSNQFANDGVIKMHGNNSEMQNPMAAVMNPEDKQIKIHYEESNLLVPESRAMEQEQILKLPGDATLLGHPATLFEHDGEFAATGDADITDSSILPIGHTGRMHGTSNFEMSFANEEILVPSDTRIRIRDGNMNLSFQDTKSLEETDSFTTAESISLSDAPSLMVEADGSVQTDTSAFLSKDHVIEQMAEALIQTKELASIDFGHNAHLEIETGAAQTVTKALMIAKRLCGMDADVEITTDETAFMIAVICKLLESETIVQTKAQGEMLLRLMRFAESNVVVKASAEAEILTRIPKQMKGADSRIATGYDAFMDASYVRGDSCSTETDIVFEALADMAAVTTNASIVAKSKVQTVYEMNLGQIPATGMDGSSLAKTGAEAHLMMARSELILADVYEEVLVSELEEQMSNDVERHLIFD